jgi:hypothetical protein
LAPQIYNSKRACKKRRANKNTSTRKKIIDPLESIKQHYFQVFLEEYAQPNIAPEQSDAVQNEISILVDQVSVSAHQLYVFLNSQIPKNTPLFLQKDAKQYLNFLTAEICRSHEKVIEATVKWMAEDDPLRLSKVGRLVRRIIPSEKQRAVDRAVITAKKNIDNLSRKFGEEIRRKHQKR